MNIYEGLRRIGVVIIAGYAVAAIATVAYAGWQGSVVPRDIFRVTSSEGYPYSVYAYSREAAQRAAEMPADSAEAAAVGDGPSFRTSEEPDRHALTAGFKAAWPLAAVALVGWIVLALMGRISGWILRGFLNR